MQKTFQAQSYYHILFVVVTLLYSLAGLCQCSSIPAIGSCSGGNGAAGNGQNINNGETYWFSGSGTFGSGVNLNGGTLRVCGTLTLNNLNFGSGTIAIEPGGTLVVNGSGVLFLNGNTTIVNHGSLHINRSVILQNSNNFIYNSSTGMIFMDAGSYILEINSGSSFLINEGTLHIDELFIQGSAAENAVCLNTGSCINLTSFENNKTNSVTAPSGIASIQYSGNAHLNSSLTNNPDVIICQMTGATSSGGGNFGAATIMQDCMSCSYALPITLQTFSVRLIKQWVQISWVTSSELNNDYFIVERSIDTRDWEVLGYINGQGNSSNRHEYSFFDEVPNRGDNYYRLTQVDFDGRFEYFPLKHINNSKQPLSASTMQVFPNPSYNTLRVYLQGEIIRQIHVYSILGQDVYSQTNMHENELSEIDISALSSGIYLLQVNSSPPQRFVKKSF